MAQIQEYRTPENIEQEMKREAHLSFLGFTIFDAGHIVLAIFFLIWSLIRRGPDYQEDITESIILLIFAVLLLSFVEGLAQHHIAVSSFRRYYSYAFLCASASLLVPLAITIPEAIHFEFNFVFELTETIAFFVTLAALALFFASLFFQKRHFAWRLITAIGVILFLAYTPLMVVGTFFRGAFSWMTIVRIFHYILPVFPGVIALFRLLRKAENSVLY
jgi:hypothetical protein